MSAQPETVNERRLESLFAERRGNKRSTRVDLSPYPNLEIREVAYLLSKTVKLLSRGARVRDAQVAFCGLSEPDRQALLRGVDFRDDLQLVARTFEIEGELAVKLAAVRLVEVDGRRKPLVIGRSRRKMMTIIARDGDRCVWCGLRLDYIDPQASLDHLVPESHGGPSSFVNLVLACTPCNVARDCTPVREWMRFQLARGAEVQVETLERRLAELERDLALKQRVKRFSSLINRSAHAVNWGEVEGGPEIPDLDFSRFTGKLNAALHDLLERAPLLRDQAASTLFLLDSAASGGDLAYASITDDEDCEPSVAVYSEQIDLLDHEQLIFLLAHELTHLRLGHYQGADRPEHCDETVLRIVRRASEAHCNDHVRAAGIEIPKSFPVPVPTGSDAIGFSLLGLSLDEVWRCLAGQVGRAETQALAASRSGRELQTGGLTAAAYAPAAQSVAFWQERFGAWQEAWNGEHARLVKVLRD